MANWEQKKVVVGNTIVTVERGQMVASNSFLMERWGVCTHTVRNFLRLLEADGMITQTTYPKYNIITICNYDKYQNKEIVKVDPSADLKVTPNADLNADPLTDPNADPNKEYKNIRTKEDIIPPTPQGGMQDGEQTELFPDDAPPKKPKGKKKDNEEHFDFKSALIGIGVSESVADKWIKVRKINYGSKADEKNTEDAFNRAKRNIETLKKTLNYTADEIIMVAVERNWTGVEVKYYKDVTPKPVSITQNQGVTTSPHEKIDEMGNRYYIQGSTKVIIPTDAPPRPNPMMYWNPIHNIWYQPF